MRHLVAVTLVLLASPLFSQSHFDGTWEMKMNSLQFSGPTEAYLIENGMITA